MVLLTTIPAYSIYYDYNWTWLQGGNTPIRIDNNFSFGNSSSTQSDQFKCYIVDGVAGHTIHSIGGDISVEQIGNNDSYNNLGNVFSMHVFITNSTYGRTTVNGQCGDSNSILMPHSAMGEHNMVRVLGGHYHLDGQTSLTIPYDFSNVEIKVPDGWHVLVIGYSQTSQPVGWKGIINEQLMLYMS